MTVNFKKLDPRATVPTYGTDYSGGADLRAILAEPITINSHDSAFFRTGLAVAIPEGYVGLIYARSGLACKKGLAPSNKVGVIDADYRGEIMVALYNHSDCEQIIENNERVAQMIITPFIHVDYNEVDELDATVRGTGGFGSTGAT